MCHAHTAALANGICHSTCYQLLKKENVFLHHTCKIKPTVTCANKCEGFQFALSKINPDSVPDSIDKEVPLDGEQLTFSDLMSEVHVALR